MCSLYVESAIAQKELRRSIIGRFLLTEIPGFVSVSEYALQKGVHQETVKRWLRDGKVEGYKMAGPSWLIPHPGQTAKSCPGCKANPIGPAQIFLDAHLNFWHQECAGVLLAKFIEIRAQQVEALRSKS
jgi:hypothetical protein